MTPIRTDVEAACIRDVVHFLNTEEQRGVLKGLPGRKGTQEELWHDFALIVRGDELPPERLKRLDKEAWAVSIRRARTDPDDRKPIWYFGCKTVEAIASFQALAIYQARLQRGFPGDLRRCKHCDKFFFSSDESEQSGRPRTNFCSEKHMQDHLKETGADRKAASRAGVPVEEWRRRMSLKREIET